MFRTPQNQEWSLNILARGDCLPSDGYSEFLSPVQGINQVRINGVCSNSQYLLDATFAGSKGSYEIMVDGDVVFTGTQHQSQAFSYAALTKTSIIVIIA